MKWWRKFWGPPQSDEDSPGLKDAQSRLEEAKQQREEMRQLMERHRKVRVKNHLGPSATYAMRKKES